MDKKSEKISGALSELSEDIIEKADSERLRLINKRNLARKRVIIGFGSAAACFVLAVGVFAAVGQSRGAINSTDPEQPIDIAPPPAAVTAVTTDEDIRTTSPGGTLNDVITSGSFHTGTINSQTAASTISKDNEPVNTTTVTEAEPSTASPTTARKPPHDDIEINAEPLCYVEYPKMPECPQMLDYMYPDGSLDNEYYEKRNEYNRSVDEIRELAKDISEYSNFYSTSAREILGSAGSDNIVYSPLAVYEALSMLAEVTDGSTREEVLEVLGSPDIETQRERAQALFVTNYNENEKGLMLPAASLWINADYPYKMETVDSLAFNYFAESYLFDGYDNSSSKRIQDWLNGKTKGLLKNAVSGVELKPETILKLCTTMYFSGEWVVPFSKGLTKEMTFHSPDGDILTDFMYKGEVGNLFLGSNFTAVIRSFKVNYGSMYFILPNEGETVDDVLASDEYLDFVLSNNPQDSFDYYNAIVHQQIPKFDIQSDIFLNEELENLGISEVFSDSGDFSNLISDDYPAFVDEIQHAARIKIDEKGCKAAAFVTTNLWGASRQPQEEVYFTADRPFIIVIKSHTNQPLFMGVVNNP